MCDINKLRKQINSAFSLSGYKIQSQACAFLLDQLKPLPPNEQNLWLNKLTAHVQTQELKLPVVGQNEIELAIKSCSRSRSDDTESIFSVISAFDVPKFYYNEERKKFLPEDRKSELGTVQYMPIVNMKSDYMKYRYAVLYQRISRHELFCPPVIGKKIEPGKKFNLRTVETLLSLSKMNNVVVLGLLTQLKEGQFFIEDVTGAVPINITNARFHNGLFCEGCFILAEGNYEDGILMVHGLGFPPPETAKNSRAYFGTLNTWGGPSRTLLKLSPKLAAIENNNADATIAFLSDVWLDSPQVMAKLGELFSGYDSCPPVAIVLMGPFVRENGNPFNLKNHLSALGDLISNFENIKTETDIILVPSADDPSAPKLLPRLPIPECLATSLLKKIPRVKLATNPCRLQYCTQQVLVCRADLLTKMCRNAVKFPTEGDLGEHFARTLICQGTLAPVTQLVVPTLWAHDAALSLYPLPDLIVIGDTSSGFNASLYDCLVINTGSFPKSKFSFKVYVPAIRTIEDSQISDKDD
ncbi:DNA polymerase epsilon subunit 2-like [Ctenocephalides felis]|uniref:DNA polymerase epsilon subunit 2-like n=1 Tax=Ctenocephalides felis TaxID=7515 RepID=UPI000E6E4049|nr:DNA polymerase epsilon subunit 2-like [Ctenocephalides felis]